MTKSEYLQVKKYVESTSQSQMLKAMLFSGLFTGFFNAFFFYLFSTHEDYTFFKYLFSKWGMIIFVAMFFCGVLNVWLSYWLSKKGIQKWEKQNGI